MIVVLVETSMLAIFIRHGQTFHNTSPYIQGQEDVPLNAIGKREARQARHHLDNSLETDVDLVFTSDLKRSRQTANIMFPTKEIHQDKRFREQDFGVATGSTFEEFFEQNPEFLSDGGVVADVPYPGGESTRDVCDRVLDGLRDIYETHGSETVVAIITHMIPMTCIKALIKDQSIESTDADIDNCETLVLDISEDHLNNSIQSSS